ncbi:hypothetical protein BC832DRAFT_145500 [Gaertneriomyces semiglobifer]|nr:hypothetical protein BC832DRAFT_145500 [Gaertneriomyces semiglobifer]
MTFPFKHSVCHSCSLFPLRLSERRDGLFGDCNQWISKHCPHLPSSTSSLVQFIVRFPAAVVTLVRDCDLNDGKVIHHGKPYATREKPFQNEYKRAEPRLLPIPFIAGAGYTVMVRVIIILVCCPKASSPRVRTNRSCYLFVPQRLRVSDCLHSYMCHVTCIFFAWLRYKEAGSVVKPCSCSPSACIPQERKMRDKWRKKRQRRLKRKRRKMRARSK